jgi:hypothetical protein
MLRTGGIILCLLLSSRCLFAGDPVHEYIVYYGKHSNQTERAVCRDLKNDIEAVTGKGVLVLAEPATLPDSGNYYLVGTPRSSALIKQLISKGKIRWETGKMGLQGGVISSLEPGSAHVVVLAGATVEGAQNTVYAYSKSALRIDPLSYWTGLRPAISKKPLAHLVKDCIVPSPAVPIICYMENDVDELANMQKPYLEYSMDTWKGMVNSLRRMHYNAIQFFDMLGRPEFYTRSAYKKLVPDYHADMALVDSMIDYAHLKGMNIQVDLSLGYQVESLSDSEALCWSRYKDQWIKIWIYYLTKTPLGKADIYSLRPRNQVWDRAYVSSCGENKIDVFNDVFRVFDSVLHVYKPQARKICICYDDGMTMFNEGFHPPKDFIIAWSDDGYGNFKLLPASTKGYPFGTYMHAGYWTNHTVHDPYPLKIDSVMTFMKQRYNAVDYLEVNGQTFRPFLLNLDAFSKWAYNPALFNGKTFYHQWCVYYFGPEAAVNAVASMKALHAAQFDRTGYVRNLGQIKSLLGYLSDKAVVSSRGIAYRVNYDRLHFPHLSGRKQHLDAALKQASAGLGKGKGNRARFYDDFVYLPALMYNQLINFEITLMKAADHKHFYEVKHQKKNIIIARKLAKSAFDQLRIIYKTCMGGDRNPKWKGWYDPAKRRPNNGFPTLKMIEAVQANLKIMASK